MLQSNVAVVVVATIVLMSALHNGEARSIGNLKKYGKIEGTTRRVRHQETFVHRRMTPLDHFSAGEALEMRKARRQERDRVRGLTQSELATQTERGRGETNHQPEVQTDSASQPPTRQLNEADVNLHRGMSGLFEGDMILTPDQKDILKRLNEEKKEEKDGSRVYSEAVRVHFLYRWENGVVPYVLGKNLRNKTISAIHDAMDEIERVTEKCVAFEEKSNEQDYLYFISGNGCWSEVGRIGGRQVISIMNTDSRGYTCAIKGVVMHEILHALGRFHEQNRHDRDIYVDIHWNNILEGWQHNFKIQPQAVADTQHMCYDYNSIMHYGAYDYAKDRSTPVISAKCGEEISGQRKYLTKRDILHIIKAYCPERDNS